MTRRALASLLALGASSGAVAGCVLLDPPDTLPMVSDQPPSIVNTSVNPPAGVLAIWPDTFYVPVNVYDPAQSLYWVAYIDNAITQHPGEQTPEVPAVDGGVLRKITVRSLSQPIGPGCHTVEIVVASGFGGSFLPAAPGGDSVQWLYTGSGNPGDCTPYDAGWLVDGTFPDSGQKDVTVHDGGE
jgi:hypothetical protein